MARIVFAPAIQRHVPVPARASDAGTVAVALDAVFADHAELRGYLLDDQGALRKHVAVFVDGRLIKDRRRMSDPVAADSEIYVVQALSGG